MFIVMDDGTLVARKPFSPRDIGSSIAKSPTFQVMAAHDAGTYEANSAVDGVRRIFTYARVPGTPLIATVAPAVDDVLAPWRRRSRITGVLTLTFGAVFVMVSWLLSLALRDKLRAQAALVRLAATDPLTGLSNRCVLDTRLDEEWRRARRSGRPLSVLFIDVDHFKRFNDVDGHASGDEALITVAECISAAVRRWVDVVARYGGEEFAVILAADAGRGRAQRGGNDSPQRAGAGCHPPRRRSGQRPVSVGCATCVPAGGASALDLLAAADRQLYAAKAAGRNRISSPARAERPIAQDSPS
ncbi:diguanylate cyclase [Paraburkholderia aromaticivorans]|uniref:diguanylate cyclase n=1 Tax=Paraburkholderia aromaticivorans TaxID=2026199 RepID=A0A248VRI4_9BURK|nr:hypothetical protein CJU94_26240 [Paraburkholderia aromaticivorans]